MKDKRGSEKYYIIISLILGLIVLGLSMYFIFQEFFTEDDLNFETCKQSIVLRANLPEVKYAGLDWYSFKDDFPLKCKTNVIEVKKEEVKDLNQIVGNAMAECWALFGNGDYNAFPSSVVGFNSLCVPCARIHLTEDAKTLLNEEPLDIGAALDSRMNGDYSYYIYLNNSGKKFPAFNIGSAIPFDLEGDNFRIEETSLYSVILKKAAGIFFEDLDGEEYLIYPSNRLNRETITVHHGGDVFLPRYFYADKGDLIINYGVATVAETYDFGDYVPYLFYYQENQDVDPFEEIEKGVLGNLGVCENWDGVPA